MGELTIPAVLARAAEAFPDAEAVVDGDVRVTFAQLRDRVREHGQVSNLRIAHGFAPDVEAMVDLMVGVGYAREDIGIAPIGPVIGTHGGPRVMGLTWLDPA